ncbi:MAG: Spy/CpxP family protein refolding chaperone [Arcobacter sp.]|uniref:Spy/CpxP family protein refolding chaperone n=1 Tax=Arcobacter sp. TaxID=1872629 RepID=UPI00258D7A9F|nr:Spy/CpxP family protein refolding chaperone [Arcobacter sp.]MDD3007475.1 Spy/CpxP family protein refolding chaperone [Arcobacter sp.]
MKIKNKIVSGLVLSSLLAGGLYAANCEMDKKENMRKNDSSCMMHKGKFENKNHRGEFHIFGIFKELNLTAEQDEKIKKIIEDSRKNEKSLNEAFTKDGFDKAKYIQIMTEKRDNMLKSNAEVIEKSYAVLTDKQKEQLKVLMDLRKEKMDKRL